MIGRIIETFFFLFAVGAVVLGFSQLTMATAGVGLFAVAGVLAIFMRIAQADRHQRENEEWLDKIFNLLVMIESKKRE